MQGIFNVMQSSSFDWSQLPGGVGVGPFFGALWKADVEMKAELSSRNLQNFCDTLQNLGNLFNPSATSSTFKGKKHGYFLKEITFFSLAKTLMGKMFGIF